MEPLVLPSLVVAAPDSGIAIDRDLPFAHPEGRALHANLFHPAGEPRGTVLLVHGEPALEEGGVFWGEDRRVKDTAPLESWSRLLAAGGLAAVSFNHRATAGFTAPEAVDRDLDALVAWLERRGLPVDRLGLLAFSGGTPFALRLARRDPRVRAVVTLYGPLELRDPALARWFPAAAHPSARRWNPSEADEAPAPHVHVWPERDWLPNGAEAYAAHARSRGFPFRLLRHPDGGHGFDFLIDDVTTTRIIEEVLDFFVGRIGETWAEVPLFGESR